MKISKRSARACLRELSDPRSKWFWYHRDCWDALDAMCHGGEWLEDEGHAYLTFALAASIAGVVDKRGLPV